MKSLTRVGVALLLPAVLLTGCGGGKKNAATVNGEAITEEEFYDRALNIGFADLAMPYQMGQQQIKAGELAIQNLIFEKLMLQLGKEKKALPSEADINAYIPFAKKYQQNPQATLVAPDPARSEAQWRRDVKLALIRRNLAMEPLKITEDDIKKEYDVVKNQITPPDQYHLRLIDVKTKEKAQDALDTLKKGVAFETVALTKSDDPMSKAKSGDIGFIPSTGLPKELLAVVKDLKPNEYTKQWTLVKLQSGPNGANQDHYFIAQFVEKKPGVPPPFEEARPIVVRQLIEQKDRNAFQRVQDDMVKYREKAKIEITLKPYEHLLDKKPQPAPGAPPAGVPPTGAPMGAPPTGSGG